MSVLSDSIELFIKELMDQSGEVAVQRNALAQHFSCAPSQINYVLATRFTLERGYTIISRRGGGGYIRILRVDMDRNSLLHQTAMLIGPRLSLREARNMIQQFYSQQLINEREAALMQAAVSGSGMPTEELQDTVRANSMRSMITALMQY